MSSFQRVISRIPWAYTFRRLLIAIPTMLAIITMAFLMMRAAPGGPFDGERKLPPATEAAIAAKFGFDKPLHEQYLSYVGGVVTGDFGPSYKTLGKSVNDLIADGLPISLTIGFLSMGLGIAVGTLLGVFAGLRQNSAADYSVMGIAMAGISIPTFVTGPILILIFALGAGIFAVGGLGTYPNIGMNWHNMTLPVITLALPQIAIIARLMRASMIEVIRSNYIRTARAKGLSAVSVIIRHALRAAVLPLVSYLGPASAAVISGSLVIERVFQLPGMGAYFVDAALQRDYTLVMGVVVVYATLIIVLNLIADLIYSVLNPRVSYDS